MRVLVAGGAGFIGSHLCDRLTGEGHEVICVDSLITGRLGNVKHLSRRASFTFVQHDIVHDLPSLPRVDRVYHLASPAGPLLYQRYAVEALRANSEGTRRLLEVGVSDGARFLFASSSAVYGEPRQHPQREAYRGNVNPVGPRSMFEEAKRYGEALTMAFAAHEGIDGRIVRVFNTYGPRADPRGGTMVASFVAQALHDEPLTVYGDGTQTRSLCYVSDMVTGLMQAMECELARGQAINLGNPDEHSVLEYAVIIRELVGSNSHIVFAPPPVGDDPKRRRPMVEKARRLLGWTPAISLQEGLGDTIDHFRRELAKERHTTPKRPAPKPEPLRRATASAS